MFVRASTCILVASLCACGGSGSSSGASPLPPASVTNLGVAAGAIEGGANLWVTSVREDPQSADLNGDGDRDDTLVHVYDSSTKVLHATGLEGGTSAVVANDRFAAFLAHEKDGDLDGDGDLGDDVLHLWDPIRSETVNLGVAVVDLGPLNRPLAIEDELLAARVNEAAQDDDLNGDGDREDDVVEVFRPGTGERWNTTVAVWQTDLEIHSGLVVLEIREEAQGADFNGDGDQQDGITAFFDPATEILQNAGAERGGFGVLPAGDVFGMSVPEDRTDWNGDGDPFDFVGFTYDHVTGEGRVTPFGGSLIDGRDGRFALAVNENTADWNGDGDRADRVAFLYEPRTGALLPTGLAFEPIFPWSGFAGDDLLVFCSESAQGADLNGDGDRADSVLNVVDRTGTVRNTRVAGTGYTVHGGVLFLSRDEVADGRDWNGDGDRMDAVLFAFDPLTGRFTSLSVLDFEIDQLGAERALVKAFEGEERADLNGDGDRDDAIYLIQDLTGQRWNTGISLALDNDARATLEGSFVLTAWELQEGKDLNGDGDLDDHVLFVVE